MEETEYSPMQQAKRRMYAMRNGIVADALRRAGSPFKIIFGVNLPQLAEIAAGIGPNKDLARQLWLDSHTRESALIAPMLAPKDGFSEEEAMQWIAESPANEATDVLCLKLLRLQPYALSLAGRLLDSSDSKQRYAGLRLMCNLAPQHPEKAVEAWHCFENAELGASERQMLAILQSYAEMI